MRRGPPSPRIEREPQSVAPRDRWRANGDTVTLTFSRNGQDETVGGQWYAGDGVPWEGGEASDQYRCPDSKCTTRSVRLSSTYPSVTYTATRVQGRKVQFITTGGSCVYGPY